MKRENSIFLAAPAAALIVNFLFLQDADYKIPFLSLVLLLAAAFAVGVYAETKKASRDTKAMLAKSGGLVLATLAMMQVVCVFRQDYLGNTKILLKWTYLLAMILAYIILIFVITNGEITENTVFLILLAGICIRAFYVVLTQVPLYQSNAGTLSSDYVGHLGYIYHFYSKGTLPDFNPQNYDQFYHPPLHYMLSAVWLKLNGAFGKNSANIEELLQSLSLFYAGCTLGFLNKIGIKLRISCRGRAIALGLASFLPFGIMMAGSVSNDGLMLLFSVMAIYFTLNWFEEPVMKNILLTAFTVGCAMMTKLSAGLIVPAIAVIILIKLRKDRRHTKNFIVQLLCFALAVFLLGLWYPVKNLIQYGIPITYAYNPGVNEAQMADVSDSIPVSVVKSLAYGEGRSYLQNNIVERLGSWVFYLTMAFLALAFVGTIIWLFRREAESHARLLILISILVVTIAYFKHCFDYPHVYTVNVGYIMLPVYFCFLGLGGLFSEEEEQSVIALIGKGFLGTALLYMVLSTLFIFNMQTVFSM